MANTKIRVTDFDFDTLKSDFKQYLSSKPEFTDFNYDGSNWNVLLDILAYNTHYNALMANFLANEMYLDTAAKRSSIVSHAKGLGYTPKSYTASKASVNITLTTSEVNPPTSIVIPRGLRFTTSIDGNSYNFTTNKSYSATAVTVGATKTYTFIGVELLNGTLVAQSFLYSRLTNLISIANGNIDISTLTVDVSHENVVTSSYDKVINFLAVEEDSKVFYTQESFDGNYELYFGDGILGYQPLDGSAVDVTYITTSGLGANGAKTFSATSTFGLTNPIISIVTTANSVGGQDRETDDSIKFNAINFFGSQNRAVIASDYRLLVSLFANNIRSVLTWGGEDNVPPQFGKVFLCIIPEEGEKLTIAEKEAIVAFLKTKAVANTRIEFNDPEYLDLTVNTEFVYNKNTLTIGVSDVESQVRLAIDEFAELNLGKFDSIFRYSTLVREIDIVHNSILNNRLDIGVKKYFSPTLYELQDINLNVYNEIDGKAIIPAITSTGFSIAGSQNIMYFEDDRQGRIKMVYYSNNVKNTFNAFAGKVNYIDGVVNINPVEIVSYVGDFIEFTIKPARVDIVSKRNVVVRLQDKNITISSRADYI